MLISAKGEYALRILVDIAEHQSEGYLTLKEIAARQEISEKYMELIVKILVSGGFLTAQRGKGGGYRFLRSPEQITVWDVLSRTESSLAPMGGRFPSGTASHAGMAGTIAMWQGLEDGIRTYLSRFTIGDLARSAEPGNDYII